MAKRFTCTDKWKKPWFRKLPVHYKVLWFYILDNCDACGVWDVDFELASFKIGYIFDESEAIKVLEKQVKAISESRWWVTDFISYQYGNLSETCMPHRSVINLLKKHTLWKGYSKGIDNLKDKDKEKDKEKEKEKEAEIAFELIWKQYPNKDGRKEALSHYRASVKNEKDQDDIQTALNNYLKSKRVKDGFIKNGSTWFNNWRDWIAPGVQDKKWDEV